MFCFCFCFWFFLVFGTSTIDHFLVVVVFVQAKLCSRRVIEVIIIPVLLLVLTADSTLTRLGCMAAAADAADAADALTGEMLMEYADLSEKTQERKVDELFVSTKQHSLTTGFT